MNNKDKKIAVEALRNQFKKTGKYQNWRHVSLDTSSDILDFATNNKKVCLDIFHQPRRHIEKAQILLQKQKMQL